jgi:hypothetical protein
MLRLILRRFFKQLIRNAIGVILPDTMIEWPIHLDTAY